MAPPPLVIPLISADGVQSSITIPGPTIGVTPPPPPPTNTLPFSTGVYLTWQTVNYAAYDTWNNNHKVKFATVFGSRDTVAQLTGPAFVVDPATAAGKIVCISFQGNLDTEAWNSITPATYAQRAATFGAFLIAHGQPNAAIRLKTEANISSSGDAAINPNDPTQVAAYAAALAAMSKALKATPGQNFTLLCDYSFDPGSGTNPTAMLDSVLPYVDGYGFDDYDGDAQWGSNWTNETDEWNQRWLGVNGNGLGYQFYVNYCKKNNKWLFLPEMGLGYYYGSNGATQVPPDDEGLFITNMFAVLSDPTLNVGAVCFWEDGNGIYSSPKTIDLTNTTKAWFQTFGSEDPAPWPRSGVTPPPPPPINPNGPFGITTLGSKLDASPAPNYRFGCIFQAPRTDVIAALKVGVGVPGAAGTFAPVVYNATDEFTPTMQIASGSAVKIAPKQAAGFQLCKLTTPTPVVAGQWYALDVFMDPKNPPNSVPLYYDPNGSQPNVYAQNAGTAYPTPDTSWAPGKPYVGTAVGTYSISAVYESDMPAS